MITIITSIPLCFESMSPDSLTHVMPVFHVRCWYRAIALHCNPYTRWTAALVRFWLHFLVLGHCSVTKLNLCNVTRKAEVIMNKQPPKKIPWCFYVWLVLLKKKKKKRENCRTQMASKSKNTSITLVTVRKVQMNLGLIKIKYNSQGKSSLNSFMLNQCINEKESLLLHVFEIYIDFSLLQLRENVQYDIYHISTFNHKSLVHMGGGEIQEQMMKNIYTHSTVKCNDGVGLLLGVRLSSSLLWTALCTWSNAQSWYKYTHKSVR